MLTSKKRRKSIRKCYCGGIVWKLFAQTAEGKMKGGGRHPFMFFRADCGSCPLTYTPEQFDELEDYKRGEHTV